MIRWCSYCQSFIGEKPPYNNLEFTHIICPSCKSKHMKGQIDLEPINKIKDFFHRVLDSAYEQRVEDAQIIVSQGYELGMDPVSLFEGIFSPVMHSLCIDVMNEKISQDIEQNFLNTVYETIDYLNQKLDSDLKADTPLVSILNLGQTGHNLGMQVFALKLKTEGFNVKTIETVQHFSSITEHIEVHRPMILAMSFAHKKDLSTLNFIAHSIKSYFADKAPMISIGGSGLKNVKNIDPIYDYVQNIADSQEFFNFIKQINKNNDAA